MVYDSDYREAPLAAIDTAYPLTQQGADTPGAFVVPTTASRITEIKIGFGSIATDVIMGATSAIKLEGTGLRVPAVFLVGPMIAAAGAAATDGGFAVTQSMKYKTNIGVVGGNTIEVTGYMHGEVIGIGHLVVTIIYDGVPGKIVGGDYREETTGAAANTLVTLGRRGAVAEGDIIPAGTIGEIVFGAIPDPVGHASDGLLIAPTLHLSGNGLLVNGNYKFTGSVGSQHPDTDIVGTGALALLPERYECGSGIATKANGRIRAQAQNIESIQSIHAIVGLCYV